MLHLPDKGIHLGFIEKWWLVNPLALLGIAVARLRPKTKFPPCWTCFNQHLGIIVPHHYGHGRNNGLEIANRYFSISILSRLDSLLHQRYCFPPFIR